MASVVSEARALQRSAQYLDGEAEHPTVTYRNFLSAARHAREGAGRLRSPEALGLPLNLLLLALKLFAL